MKCNTFIVNILLRFCELYSYDPAKCLVTLSCFSVQGRPYYIWQFEERVKKEKIGVCNYIMCSHRLFCTFPTTLCWTGIKELIWKILSF